MKQFGLVADVGGTNIRLALVHMQTGEISQINKYLCNQFSTIDAVIACYLSEVNLSVSQACIAIACPVEDDVVTMTNHSWTFSKQALIQNLGLESLWVINDYTAIAMSIPTLGDDQKIQIGGGEAVMQAPIAVYGPGTGLGVAHLVCYEKLFIPLSGEGGHVDLAAVNQRQADVVAELQKKYERVSFERVLSGPGLVNIYAALCVVNSRPVESYQPADITQKGMSGECAICCEAMDVFCQFMGSFGGNLALNMGTFGGVYIAGGIVSRFTDYFLSSDFRHFFESKGRMSTLCQDIPVYLITEQQPGLQGAAAYMRQSIGFHI